MRVGGQYVLTVTVLTLISLSVYHTEIVGDLGRAA